MSLIDCPACGNRVSENALTCPGCGEPIKSSVEQGAGGASDAAGESEMNEEQKPKESMLAREFKVGTTKKGKIVVAVLVVVSALIVGYRLVPVLIEEQSRPKASTKTETKRAPGPTTTKKGYIACQTDEWLNDVFAFLRTDDNASLGAYLSAGKCIALEDGAEVTVTDWGIATTEFVYKGTKYYTPTEAINR